MIKIDMDMPGNCTSCPFIDQVTSSCLASGDDPGFTVFVGLQSVEIVEYDDWQRKASSGRDPRCPLKDEHAVCVNCAFQPTRPTWQQGKAYCGNCGKRIPTQIEANYCHKCGREILWI